MNSPSLLLIAYQCGPGMGSVSQIGWEWYARLSAGQKLTLVTHVRNRTALQAVGAPLPGSEIVYVDTEWFAGPLYRLARRIFPRSEHSVFLVSSLDYFVFDLAAFLRLRKAQVEGARWGVLHRVTPVTVSAPSWLARLGLPTVLGPLNSGLHDPAGFASVMKQESTWLIRVRSVARVLESVAGSTRRAARILTATRATREAVGAKAHDRCRMMIENGVDLARFSATPWPEAPGASKSLRVLFVGRLIPLKGLDMLLAAVARMRHEGLAVVLDVTGDGPMLADWKQLAEKLGIGNSVCFHGAAPLDTVARQMQHCHVFCLPSVRESGGAVLLEAMASARPVVALDFGGPGELVDEAVGALLPLTNPAQVTEDLAATLRDVFANPGEWRRRGQAGRERAESRYAWPAKIAAARAIYDEVIAERGAAC